MKKSIASKWSNLAENPDRFSGDPIPNFLKKGQFCKKFCKVLKTSKWSNLAENPDGFSGDLYPDFLKIGQLLQEILKHQNGQISQKIVMAFREIFILIF